MTQLTTNVFIQNVGESLSDFLTQASAPLESQKQIRPKFIHCVSPFVADAERNNEQILTFQSMRTARELYLRQTTETFGSSGGVELVCASFVSDIAFAKKFSSCISLLHRSCNDLERFSNTRKLPFLSDVLRTAISIVDPKDYIVFTNSDICLTPSFYQVASIFLSMGFDGIVINRRTLPRFPLDPNLLPLMSVVTGDTHPGVDCFIISAVAFLRFDFSAETILGVPAVMRPLLFNMVAQCNRVAIFKDIHATFHIGNDEIWRDPENSGIWEHNLREVKAFSGRLTGMGESRVKEFCRAHGEPASIQPDRWLVES